MTYLTEKMRKRDMAANAVLAAGLIGNLQSPQHFVRSGHIEAPGVQLMQRMMKKRKEANRNLDSGVVAQGARNRSNVSAPSTRKRMATAYDRMKKQKREKADEIIRDLRKEQKTFQDFMLECYELEESSGDERRIRRLFPRGPSANGFDRNRQRQNNSNRAALDRIREWIDILEVKRPESGTDVEKERWDRAKARLNALENPSSMFVGTTGRDKQGNRKYGLKSSERKKEQGKRRRKNLRPLTTRELEDHAKRNLHPTPAKTAKKAIRIERNRKRAQRNDATTRTQQTGQRHDVDHIQGQPNRRPEGLRSRFQAIHPGDASDNKQVIHGDENRTKNSKNTQRSTTRSGAIMKALQRAKEK